MSNQQFQQLVKSVERSTKALAVAEVEKYHENAAQHFTHGKQLGSILIIFSTSVSASSSNAAGMWYMIGEDLWIWVHGQEGSHLGVVCALSLGIELPAVIRAHDVALAADVPITQRRQPAGSLAGSRYDFQFGMKDNAQVVAFATLLSMLKLFASLVTNAWLSTPSKDPSSESGCKALPSA